MGKLLANMKYDLIRSTCLKVNNELIIEFLKSIVECFAVGKCVHFNVYCVSAY